MIEEDRESNRCNIVPPLEQEWCEFASRDSFFASLKTDLSTLEWRIEKQSDGKSEVWISPHSDLCYVAMETDDDGSLTFLQLGIAPDGKDDWCAHIAMTAIRLISVYQLQVEA